VAKNTVLITGGAGFLGSHLTDKYLSLGYRVVCIDNLSTGSKNNIKHLSNNPDFIFLHKDICDDLTDDLKQYNFSVVANLASPASPPHYQRLALETLKVGSIGLNNVIEIARNNNARFFQASTSEVYGDPEIHPQPESYKGSVNPYGPRSMYDESKRFSEAMIYVYRNKYKVNTCIARFFNTYGPRMDPNDGRVVSNFIVQSLKGDPITIYGKGDQTRSFCYVDDLVDGIVKLIDSKEEGPINMGNPGEFTIMELAEKIKDLTGTQSKFIYKPLPGDDPMQRKPVIELAKSKLNWEPKIMLDQGLAKTIEYFKSVI
jgi:UDP-glucuronate decarboxylase